ncbi:MAG: nucleotidyltransferase family protein [Candidatus Hodarchaeales archaeon]
MIAAIVLAAGQSKRFPGNKLLSELDSNKTIIDFMIDSLLKSKVQKAIFVLGHEANKLEKEILKFNNNKLLITINSNYLSGGMSSSILQGFNFALKKFTELEAVMITPADIPFIPTNVWNLIITRFTNNIVSSPIIIPKYKDRKGHPILIGSQYFNELAKISERNMGLKEIISRHWNDITFVETDSQGILHDIDRLEDLKTLKETFDI